MHFWNKNPCTFILTTFLWVFEQRPNFAFFFVKWAFYYVVTRYAIKVSTLVCTWYRHLCIFMYRGKVSTFHLAYSTLYLCILPSGSFRLLFSSLINPFFWLFGYSCFTLKFSTSNVCSLKLCIFLVNQRKWDMLSFSKCYFRKRQIKCFSKWVLLKWYI